MLIEMQNPYRVYTTIKKLHISRRRRKDRYFMADLLTRNIEKNILIRIVQNCIQYKHQLDMKRQIRHINNYTSSFTYPELRLNSPWRPSKGKYLPPPHYIIHITILLFVIDDAPIYEHFPISKKRVMSHDKANRFLLTRRTIVHNKRN